MNPVLVALCAAAAIFGVLAVVEGLVRRPRRRGDVSGPGIPVLVRARWHGATRAQQISWSLAVAGALVGYLLTRSLLVTGGVPALILVLPGLLSAPPNRDVEVLEACDRWVRLLIGSVSTGKSVPDAIRATRNQVAPVLRAPVDGLIARLDARWSTASALRAMADDLAHPDADAIIAALIVATRRGGTGTGDALRALGQHSRRRLQSLREIATERAKPRIVVRQVTLITVVVLVGVAVFNPDYVAPYLTPTGQLLGAGLLAAYLGSLVMLRRMSTPEQRERILQGDGVELAPAGGDDA